MVHVARSLDPTVIFLNGRSSVSQIKEGVKEFYVQVADQQKRENRGGKKQWHGRTRVQHKLQLASLLFREPFFFVQCLPWFLKQPARPIPGRYWKFLDFSPSKDSSMCKWPNRWSAFFLLLWPWARSPPTMNSSEWGPGRTESARYQSAPSLGFGSIPPWRTGKVGKGVGTFLRGHYTMQQQSWWGHPLFCRFSAVNIFSCTRIHAKTLHLFFA